MAEYVVPADYLVAILREAKLITKWTDNIDVDAAAAEIIRIINAATYGDLK